MMMMMMMMTMMMMMMNKGNIEDHRDHMQVVLDVNRSLKRFPKGMSDQQREVLQTQLVDVIVRVITVSFVSVIS